MSVQRFLCLRFDVDTELCLREGTPRLRALARATGTQFTFFVNPGRAIDRGQSILRAFRRARTEDSGAQFRPYEKLGRKEWLRLLAEQPKRTYRATHPRSGGYSKMDTTSGFMAAAITPRGNEMRTDGR